MFKIVFGESSIGKKGFTEISTNLIKAIQGLYKNITGAVKLGGCIFESVHVNRAAASPYSIQYLYRVGP